jgi:hypothetical protein
VVGLDLNVHLHLIKLLQLVVLAEEVQLEVL